MGTNTSLPGLYNKRAIYRALRENVANAINILSRSNIADNLSTAVYSLSNDYQVNENGYGIKSIDSVGLAINRDVKNLQGCYNSLNVCITNINREIEQKEREG